MTISFEMDGFAVYCDYSLCSAFHDGIRSHVHLNDARGDVRLDPRLDGWALDHHGRDICPECVKRRDSSPPVTASSELAFNEKRRRRRRGI